MDDKAINEMTGSNRGEKVIKEKYELPLDTQKFILQMCWAQHDGQWFLKSKNEFGVKEANLLNNKVIYSMGKIEARHILHALSIQKGSITSMSEIFKIMNTLMDVVIPKVMKFKFVVDSDIEGRGIVKRCFIWKLVQQSKKESEYTCACNYRHMGWLDALGVRGKIIALQRVSEGDGICEFKFLLDSKGSTSTE